MLRQAALLVLDAQVLDGGLAEAHVGIADLVGHDRGGPAGQRQHLPVAIQTDHPPLGPHQLGAEEGVLAAAAAQIEHCVARPHPAGGIAAAVVPLHHLGRDYLEQAGIEGDPAAEAGLRG